MRLTTIIAVIMLALFSTTLASPITTSLDPSTLKDPNAPAETATARMILKYRGGSLILLRKPRNAFTIYGSNWDETLRDSDEAVDGHGLRNELRKCGEVHSHKWKFKEHQIDETGKHWDFMAKGRIYSDIKWCYSQAIHRAGGPDHVGE